MKIVYCMNSIRYTGGIQRTTVVKANALAERDDMEVYILVSDNKRGSLVEPLSPKVKLIDLEINYYDNDWKSRWNVLKDIFLKRRFHKRRLAEALCQIKPDVVISVGQAEKNLLPCIRQEKGEWKLVREFHFPRNYRWLNARNLFERILAIGGDLTDLYTLRQYDHIVTLTEEDLQTNWHGWKNVSVIPNPVTIEVGSLSPLTDPTIVAIGRLERQKNFSSLIRAYKRVNQQHPDWKLEIYGDGSLKAKLQSLIDKLKLNGSVLLKGFTDNISEVLTHASILALSSKFEGLALTLLEAMAHGVPCVAYSVPCGLRDIITDGENGFLVAPEDEQAFADKLCTLIEDRERLRRMGEAAKKRSEAFGLETIIAKHLNLYKSLV